MGLVEAFVALLAALVGGLLLSILQAIR